ncbi:MAG: hypothetical protein AB3N19_05060 [Ruegeria sp.]
MVQNNKVLTVSYGTFSCTLEGFDDSFETMKAIAEYFRDLAADDRYFGSEPPQPDAEMLTRIAQRDQSQRVEASRNDTGLLLRATDEVSTPASPASGAPAAEQVDSTAEFFANSETDEPAASDSIAAKLQRIRAVVSHSGEASARYSEDEDENGGFVAPAQPKVDAISAAFEAGALTPADLQTQVEDEDPQPVEDLIEAEDTAQAEPVEEPVAAEVEAQVQTESEEAEVSTDDVLFTDIEEKAEADSEPDEIVNILNEETDEPEAEEIGGSEFDHDVLTAAEEAKLLDEITLVESELAKRASQPLPEADDLNDDVTRLMDTAGERMDDLETSGQRETYSHLRTAVAATEAERSDADDNAAESPDQDYRGDLESVVSPRRPEIQVTSIRPDTDTAPLKLVAEQRVDTDESDRGPVMPRRVTADQEEAEDEEGGFARFAQEQGAQSLPDLLEAAAAYLSFIEGQEQFSRPQLMNKVRSLKQESFNREESLRTFGQLLRDGKIEKAGGGRFAASNQIGFRPDDKRAAG